MEKTFWKPKKSWFFTHTAWNIQNTPKYNYLNLANFLDRHYRECLRKNLKKKEEIDFPFFLHLGIKTAEILSWC